MVREVVLSGDSDRRFKVGDCVILNETEQPCGRLVCVVTGDADAGGFYQCQYLNADPALNSYCNPPMRNRLLKATLVEDFGVDLLFKDGEYWCDPVRESVATYSDGSLRKWQEYGDPIHHRARREVAKLIRRPGL